MSDKIEITSQDIGNAVAIIDICVKRGAIEGSELSAVGAIRDKLDSYAKQEADNNADET
jgi:uncharacterized protein YggE|tara:strand:+ start:150 stop:326 length:177 start_codon:yes stop_codon:yes gene_type:complete